MKILKIDNCPRCGASRWAHKGPHVVFDKKGNTHRVECRCGAEGGNSRDAESAVMAWNMGFIVEVEGDV